MIIGFPRVVATGNTALPPASVVEMTREYRVGDVVIFDTPDGVVSGRVTRVNKRTLTVEAEDGRGYRVPPALVTFSVREDDEAQPKPEPLLELPQEPRLELPQEPGPEAAPGSLRLVGIRYDAEPRGLAFTTDARELLTSHAWLDLQGILAGAMRAFRECTGRDVAARFAAMRGLNRYNQEAPLVAIWFVFALGDTTEEEVTPLYEALRASGVRFTAEGVQPLAEPSFPTLLLNSNALFQVWLREEPEPVLMTLDWDDELESTMYTGFEVSQMGPADLLPGVAHAVLVWPDGEVEGT
jgi:hypothetical protein